MKNDTPISLNSSSLKNQVVLENKKQVFIRESAVLYPSFFFLGFNQATFYLPFFGLYFFLKLSKMEDIKIKKQYFFLSFLMLFSIVPVFLIGFHRITLENPLRTFAVLVFAIIFAGFSFQSQKKAIQIKLLSLYVIGIGVGAITIAGYSYFINSTLYGYSKLFNPFSGTVINSPSVSNNLALFASLLLAPLFYKTSRYKLTFSLLALSIVIFLAIFLEGRAFFYILFFSLFLFLVIRFDLKVLMRFIILFSASFLLAYLLLDNLHDNLGPLIQRLSLGLKSPRFELYKSGASLLMKYPLGGYHVDTSIVNLEWFHNVFLDNGRLAGWLPVVSLFLTMSFIMQKMFRNSYRYVGLAFVIFVVSVFIMQQDVILEGNYRMLIVMYFSGLFSLKDNGEHFGS